MPKSLRQGGARSGAGTAGFAEEMETWASRDSHASQRPALPGPDFWKASAEKSPKFQTHTDTVPASHPGSRTTKLSANTPLIFGDGLCRELALPWGNAWCTSQTTPAPWPSYKYEPFGKGCWVLTAQAASSSSQGDGRERVKSRGQSTLVSILQNNTLQNTQTFVTHPVCKQ